MADEPKELMKWADDSYCPNCVNHDATTIVRTKIGRYKCNKCGSVFIGDQAITGSGGYGTRPYGS